jgi:hypothetical protein
MFSKELTELLFQVIKSWQVIAVTITLIIYMSLIGYVMRTHHKPTSVSRTKPKKKDNSKTAKPDAGAKKPDSKKSGEPEITNQD